MKISSPKEEYSFERDNFNMFSLIVYDKYSDKDRESINSLTDYKIDFYCEFTDFLKGMKAYEYKKRDY